MTVAGMRVQVVPGDGVVARFGSCVVVIGPGSQAAEVERILAIARVTGDTDSPGRTLAYRLAGYMSDAGPERTPAFAAVADAGDRLLVIAHGDISVSAATPDGAVELSGADRPTWVDDFLPEDAVSVRISGGDGSALASSDLIQGIVPGGGAVLAESDAALAVGSPVEAEREPEPVAEDAQRDAEAGPPPDVELVDLTTSNARAPLPPTGKEPASEPDGAVMVDGIRCARGHFNHPQARFCSSCGLSMVQQTHNITQGERPPLGVLVMADGRTLALDHSYVIGRDPAADAVVAAGEARPFQLEDPDQILSRVHAEVRLDGWDVQLVDRRSANGTFLQDEEGQWRRLPPEEPVTLVPGSRARLGRHEMTFDSHHQAVQA